MPRDVTIPAAILVGSVVIGSGLYFGLRRDDPASSSPATSVDPSRAGAPSSPATPPAVIPPAASPATASPTSVALDAETSKRAQNTIRKAVADAQPAWKQKCWEPAVKAKAEPSTSRYALTVSFDAAGKEVGRAISEVRDASSRSDVAQCLRQQPLSLAIAPPGAPVQHELTLQFP